MVLVSGSLAFDQIMDFPGKFSEHIDPKKIHILNVSFLVNELRKSFGGTAGNIAYNLSLLGIKAYILAMAGKDFSPYKKFLEKNEVNTKYIKIIPNQFSSTAFGMTDSTDNQIWGFYTGADKMSEFLTIKSISEKVDLGIIAPQNPKAMLKFASEYTKSKIPYLFDPGMQLPWLKGDELLEAFNGASIIIGNDYEISQMEKKTALKELQFEYTDKIIIKTLGQAGSEIYFKGEKLTVKAATVRSVSDPAGAGDAYRAGFIGGYLRKFNLETCAKMGSVAAAYTVERFGTTTHYFSEKEFIRRFKENYKEEISLS